jgi:hypothetical protein
MQKVKIFLEELMASLISNPLMYNGTSYIDFCIVKSAFFPLPVKLYGKCRVGTVYSCKPVIPVDTQT